MSINVFDDYDLTLYEMSISRSARPRWLAQELGVLDKIEQKQVALLKGDQLKPDFLKVNRMGAVPVLTLTDKTTGEETNISESAAICTFLTDFVPHGKQLKPAPTNIPGMAMYHRWITFAVASMDPQIWLIRLHSELLPEAARSAKIVEAAKKTILTKVVPTLEEVLQGNEYICEPQHKGFTTADVVVGYACLFASRYDLLKDSPVLQEYMERVTSREAFQAVWPKRSHM